MACLLQERHICIMTEVLEVPEGPLMCTIYFMMLLLAFSEDSGMAIDSFLRAYAMFNFGSDAFVHQVEANPDLWRKLQECEFALECARGFLEKCIQAGKNPFHRRFNPMKLWSFGFRSGKYGWRALEEDEIDEIADSALGPEKDSDACHDMEFKVSRKLLLNRFSEDSGMAIALHNMILLLAFSEDSGMATCKISCMMLLLAFSEDSGMAIDVRNIFYDATAGLLGRFRHGHRCAQYLA